MVEAVEEHGVVVSEQRRQNAEVYLETGREDQRGLALHEMREALFELGVNRERSVEKRRARTPGAELFDGGDGGGFDFGVAGQAQVVVRAQHDERLAVDGDDGILL